MNVIQFLQKFNLEEVRESPAAVEDHSQVAVPVGCRCCEAEDEDEDKVSFLCFSWKRKRNGDKSVCPVHNSQRQEDE